MLAMVIVAYTKGGSARLNLNGCREMFKMIEDVVALKVQGFSNQALVNIVWSYAKAGYGGFRNTLFESVAMELSSNPDRLKQLLNHHQSISNLVWSLAITDTARSHSTLFKSLVQGLLSDSSVSACNDQVITTVMWSTMLSRSDLWSPSFFSEMMSRINTKNLDPVQKVQVFQCIIDCSLSFPNEKMVCIWRI
jgi:hypothetical protein